MKKAIGIFGLCLFLCGMIFAQELPTEGLAAYYKFDEVGELTVLDHSGNGLHGEAMGLIDWDEGIDGYACVFNGFDSYVNCLNPPEFNFPDAVTLMAWVKPSDWGDGVHSPWVIKGDKQYGLKESYAGKNEFFIYDDTWYTVNVDKDVSEVGDVWHHYAGVFDGAEIKCFYDGQLDSAEVANQTIQITDYDLYIGHNSEKTDRYFTGAIDEVAIYYVALTDEQIEAVYNSYFTPVEDKASLQKEFQLDQNYPNPFNPETQISYSIPASGFVTLTVYNASGREIKTIVNGMQSPGDYTVSFSGKGLSSGVYFYTLKTNHGITETRKMLLMQ